MSGLLAWMHRLNRTITGDIDENRPNYFLYWRPDQMRME